MHCYRSSRCVINSHKEASIKWPFFRKYVVSMAAHLVAARPLLQEAFFLTNIRYWRGPFIRWKVKEYRQAARDLPHSRWVCPAIQSKKSARHFQKCLRSRWNCRHHAKGYSLQGRYWCRTTRLQWKPDPDCIGAHRWIDHARLHSWPPSTGFRGHFETAEIKY